MAADPERFLGKLEPGREVPVGAVRGLAHAVDALVAAGLIAVRRDGRRTLVRLTDDGATRRAAVAPPDRVAALEARVAALEARVAALEARRAPVATPAPTVPVKPAVLDAITELDTQGRLGGVVPIPDVRAALRARGVADDGAVTAALEELEREWRIDLNVAQAPTQVADRAAGIERPGRGLLYYVSRR